MATVAARLISGHSSTLTTLSSLPPNSPDSKNQEKRLQVRANNSRRETALLSLIALVPSLSVSAPAAAFEFGISGPKDWLREQKKKASKFLLAPIDASRNNLRTAYTLLTSDSPASSKDLEEIHNLLISAARDCVPQDRSSFVQFQANTGVEVCTFNLVVKNASSLLGSKDPVKLEAEAMLKDLISSFTSLNRTSDETDLQLSSDRGKVVDALMNTISSLDKFEQGIKECLGA